MSKRIATRIALILAVLSSSLGFVFVVQASGTFTLYDRNSPPPGLPPQMMNIHESYPGWWMWSEAPIYGVQNYHFNCHVTYMPSPDGYVPNAPGNCHGYSYAADGSFRTSVVGEMSFCGYAFGQFNPDGTADGILTVCNGLGWDKAPDDGGNGGGEAPQPDYCPVDFYYAGGAISLCRTNIHGMIAAYENGNVVFSVSFTNLESGYESLPTSGNSATEFNLYYLGNGYCQFNTQHRPGMDMAKEIPDNVRIFPCSMLDRIG